MVRACAGQRRDTASSRLCPGLSRQLQPERAQLAVDPKSEACLAAVPVSQRVRMWLSGTVRPAPRNAGAAAAGRIIGGRYHGRDAVVLWHLRPCGIARQSVEGGRHIGAHGSDGAPDAPAYRLHAKHGAEMEAHAGLSAGVDDPRDLRNRRRGAGPIGLHSGNPVRRQSQPKCAGHGGGILVRKLAVRVRRDRDVADFGVSDMICISSSEGTSKPHSGRTVRGSDSIRGARIGVRTAGLRQARRAARDSP